MSVAVPAVTVSGAACACGAREVRVVFKCPVHVVVAEGRVVRVLVARDCAEGPIVAECAGCGASDVDGDEAAAAAAALADASSWPDVSPWAEPW
ncbi:MAG: hypothetical protein ACLGI2_14500 [Acidimicrobiia bacterium]